jgi:hypothetical protein
VSLPAESIAQSMMSKSAAISNTLSKVTAALRAVSPVQAIQLLVAGVVLSARSKLKQQVQSLEGGWSKRGAGGSFMRTIEVWGFAFSYAFKYVSLTKLWTDSCIQLLTFRNLSMTFICSWQLSS